MGRIEEPLDILAQSRYVDNAVARLGLAVTPQIRERYPVTGLEA